MFRLIRRSSFLRMLVLLAMVKGFAFQQPAEAQTAHYAGVQIPLASGLSANASGAAVDAQNDMYLADTGNARLLKETPYGAGYTQSVIMDAKITTPTAVAVDGAGNLYVANGGTTKNIVKLTLSNGSYTSSVLTSQVGTPTGIAVTPDGSALYVADPSDRSIFQFAYSSGSYIQQATVTNFSKPTGLATDSTGAWYLIENGNVYKHAVGFSPVPFNGVQVVTGLSTTANAIALDSAGNLFIADTGNNQIVKVPAGSTTPSVFASNVSAPEGVAVDANGVVTVVDTGDKLAFAQNPAALNFGSAAVGTTSAAQTVAFVFDTAGSLNQTAPYQALLQGAGNLDYAAQTIASPGFVCSGGAAFTAGETCTVSVTFTPGVAGPRYGALVLNNNVGQQFALAYIAGTGLGPQVALPPSQSTLPATGLSIPQGVAVDATGNVYIADPNNNRVVKEVYANGSYTQSSTPIGSGLYYPTGVAVDGAGNIYIADYGNNRVVKEIYANGSYTQSSTAIGSGFYRPEAVAVDGAGNLYIADILHDLVVKEVYANGSYIQSNTVIGSGLSNPADLALDGAGNLYIADFGNNRVVKEVYANGSYTQSNTAIGTGLDGPQGVALDSAGDVYIADTYNNRVVKELYANGSYTQSAMTIGNGLYMPAGVAVDSAGNVYIADTNHSRVLLESVAVPPLLTFASTAVGNTSTDSPQSVTVSNTGNQPLTVSIVTAPRDYTVASSACTAAAVAAAGSCSLSYSFTPLVRGIGTENSLLNQNSLNVSNISTVLLSGTSTAGAQVINFPQPAVSGSFLAGTQIPLNATSSIGQTIHYQVTTTGTIQVTVLGTSAAEYLLLGNSGSGTITITATAQGNNNYGAAAPVSVSFMAAIVTAPQPGAALTDTAIASSTSAEVSVQFAATGTLGSVQGLTQGAPNLDYSATAGANDCVVGTTYPAGQVCTVTVTFTPTLAGPRYGAVEVLDGSGNVLGTTLLQANGLGPQIAFAPVQSILPSNGLSYPKGMAVDGAGNVYIADVLNNRVVKEVYANGSYTQSSTPIGSGLSGPQGVAVDGAGNLYIADAGNNRVVKEMYANGSYTQSSTPIGSGLDVPEGVAVDGAGNLYIADAANSRVVKEVYANGSYTQSSTAIGNDLSGPAAVAVDGSGNVYIADTNNDRAVKEVYANGAYTQSSTVIGIGLYSPEGVAVDGAGNVYIADTNHSRVVKEVYANGSYTQYGIPVGSGLSRPIGVAVDGAGNVYIGDTYNSRALMETVTAPPVLTFASTATATSSAPVATQITNLGNEPLVFPSPASGLDPQTAANFSLETNSDTTCPVVNAGGAAGQIPANASCTLSYLFAPTQVGSISGGSVLTDNNLDVAGAVQAITLNGTATQGTQTAQKISFPQPAGTMYPGSATLTATASSGLAVTYTLVSGPATLAGSTLTYTAPGTVVVTANQAGNAQIAAAPPVSISITVTQATAMISWQPATLKIYTGAALGAAILDATDSIPATISYSAALLPSGTAASVSTSSVLTQGSYGLTATFTPQDALRYGIVSDTLLFTVQNMNVFVANAVGSVSSLYNNGTPQSTSVAGGGIGAAVDNSGNVWSITKNGTNLTKFNDAGSLLATYPNASGATTSTALAIDGAGTVWTTNANGTVSAITPAGAPALTNSIGSAANLSAPASVNVDPSGSLWIANAGNNTVTEIIGVAAPVTTPTTQSVINNTVASKP